MSVPTIAIGSSSLDNGCFLLNSLLTYPHNPNVLKDGPWKVPNISENYYILINLMFFPKRSSYINHWRIKYLQTDSTGRRGMNSQSSLMRVSLPLGYKNIRQQQVSILIDFYIATYHNALMSIKKYNLIRVLG